MTESKKVIKSFLMRVKEGKAGLKLSAKKKKKNENHGIWSHHFMANRRRKSGNSAFLSSKITVDGDCINNIKRPLLLRRKAMKNLVQFSLFPQSCLTLCNPMKLSMPGLPVHHQLPEFIQTHVHCVDDGIQPSHPLSSPSPHALNLSWH